MGRGLARSFRAKRRDLAQYRCSMPTPEFIRRLRERVGHDPLWLVGVTAVVIRGSEVLLVKPTGSAHWTPVGGIVEPGEHSATAAEREVLEETRVVAEVERLAAVGGPGVRLPQRRPGSVHRSRLPTALQHGRTRSRRRRVDCCRVVPDRQHAARSSIDVGSPSAAEPLLACGLQWFVRAGI